MKRLLFIITAFICIGISSSVYASGSKTYNVYLHPSLDTGVSTSYNQTDPNSGVSYLILEGAGHSRADGTYIIDTKDMYGSWAFQLSNVSPCQAALARGSDDYSGVTFALWLRRTLDTNMWNTGTTLQVFASNTAISSGTTPIPVDISPNPLWSGASTFVAKAARLELFLSGTTPLDGLTGTLFFQPWK